jgi:hypothetical protein
MASTQVNETLVRRGVERLFGEISAKRGELCTNPVTGGEFVYGFDSMKRQKDAAYKRLLSALPRDPISGSMFEVGVEAEVARRDDEDRCWTLGGSNSNGGVPPSIGQ